MRVFAAIILVLLTPACGKRHRQRPEPDIKRVLRAHVAAEDWIELRSAADAARSAAERAAVVEFAEELGTALSARIESEPPRGGWDTPLEATALRALGVYGVRPLCRALSRVVDRALKYFVTRFHAAAAAKDPYRLCEASPAEVREFGNVAADPAAEPEVRAVALYVLFLLPVDRRSEAFTLVLPQVDLAMWNEGDGVGRALRWFTESSLGSPNGVAVIRLALESTDSSAQRGAVIVLATALTDTTIKLPGVPWVAVERLLSSADSTTAFMAAIALALGRRSTLESLELIRTRSSQRDRSQTVSVVLSGNKIRLEAVIARLRGQARAEDGNREWQLTANEVLRVLSSESAK